MRNKKQKYMSLQTKMNEIKMFCVNQEKKSFEEDDALMLCVDDKDSIKYSEFDRNFIHIFILKNGEVLEERWRGGQCFAEHQT